ncbi:MAG: ATP-binding cassette domain-containing protein [Spirochaetes bacterium]|nr:ATP-binding cassette domain-containing protein [Spirochaetota bacterium]
MIIAENITKRFGTQILFESASFKINPKEKVGLVGRNGYGKTTLFRILVGEELPDDGIVTFPKNYRLGHMRQQPYFNHKTVIDELLAVVEDENKRWEIEKTLFGLGFRDDDLQKNPHELSGGFQIRLELARVLLSNPDMLLLDEPNNFLDITSIRWLTRFLREWKKEIILITHDRSFMDSIVTHTLGIHRRKIRKIAGSTEKYYEQIALEEEIYEKTRINDERRRKEIELFISRFRAKARLANMVQSRIKMLSKMENRSKLEKIKEIEFSFSFAPTPTKYPLTASGITFSYSACQPELLGGLSISIGAKDRICVIGKNGKGKTTLLKIFAGILKPTSGSINYSQHAKIGYYEQHHIATLAETRTVLEEIQCELPNADRQQAWNICGSLLFEGDEALKKISVLSGGEKSRVALGKIIARPTNLLLLDEPTNHLDMDACDALLAALDSYEGAIVMVTHNEMLLNALAQRLIVFQGGKPFVFEGSYKRFLESIGWEDETSTLETKNGATKLSQREFRKRKAELISLRAKTLKPLETKIATTESEITALEHTLKELHESLIDASHKQDGTKIAEIGKAIHECEEKIEVLFKVLSELTVEYENNKNSFEKLLKEMG